jgi:N-acetylglucosaminyldiphosphoundecaprenol N-acetyl-beta-D-mannosaminyltransferase
MNNQTVKLFGVKFNKGDEDVLFKRFLYLLNRSRYAMIFTPNPEIVMMAQKDLEYKDILAEGDLVIPDGIGIIVASKIKKLGLEKRMPGIEMMESILKYCNNAKKSIYLLGSSEENVEKAADNIKLTYPNIIISGYHHGFFDASEELKIIDKINEVKPDILFVAMGAPKQEKWMYTHRKILNAKVAMGVGGSLDIWAGAVKRAPKFFRKIGFEWLYRMLSHPSRWKRSLVLPKFLLKVLLSRRG